MDLTGTKVKIDLRETLKLNDRIGALMAEKGSRGVIVIGTEESQRLQSASDIKCLEVSIKRKGEVQKCLVNDIAKFI